MIVGQNEIGNGDGRPLWITGLSPPDSWRSLRQPGYPQLHRIQHPQHRAWGNALKPEVSNFRLGLTSWTVYSELRIVGFSVHFLFSFGGQGRPAHDA